MEDISYIYIYIYYIYIYIQSLPKRLSCANIYKYINTDHVKPGKAKMLNRGENRTRDLGVSTLMWLNTESSRIYARTKLH